MHAISDILAHAEPALRDHSERRPPPADRHATFVWQLARDRLAPGLADALLTTKLFARPQRMLSVGAGYRGFSHFELAGQLLDVTASVGASAATAALERLQKMEALDLQHRHLVWGLTVDRPRELVPGVLVRQVDADEHQARHHEWEASDWRDWGELCAFTTRYSISPAFEIPEETALPDPDAVALQIAKRLANLTTVLVAYGGKPLTFEMGETRHQDPELQALLPFLGRSRGPGELRVLRPFGATAIDDPAVTFCRAYEALDSETRQRVLGAAVRLHRGLCRPGAAEIIIEVVRALEYLLRTPATKDGSNRNTVSRQVRLALPELGKSSRSLLDEIYALRNTAAHGEDLPGAVLQTARDSADLCARVIRKVVLSGRL